MTTKDKIIEILSEELGSGLDFDKDHVLNISGVGEEVNRNIVMLIEERLGVEISDEDAENLYTVKDIVDYVEKKTKKGE